MLRKSQGFIAGEWRDALSGKTFKVHNPFNNEEIENVADFDVKDVQDAIDNAHHTFKTWRKSTFKKRSALLKKIGDLMLENKEELGMILTSEQGKPLPEATGEVAFAASFFHFFSEECKVIILYPVTQIILYPVQETRGLGHLGLGAGEAVPDGARAPGGGGHGLPLELPHRHARQEDSSGHGSG